MKHDKKHKRNKSPKRNKKSKKSERKEKKQKHKEKKKSSKNSEKVLKISKEIPTKIVASQSSVKSPITNVEDDYCGPSIDLMNRAKCPETKADYEMRQSKIKRIVDPETGRIRLIKGDGEVLEEIVPRSRHKQINQEATRNDGASFQKKTIGLARK